MQPELQVRRAARVGARPDEREVFFVARGQQGQGVDLPVDAPLEVLGDMPAAGLEDLLCLRAIPGRGLAVAAQHRQLQLHILLLAVAPANQTQHAVGGLGFRFGDRPAEAPACIVGERFTVDAQDHIAHFKHAVGRRTRVHLRDQDLPGIRRFQQVPPHPTAGSRGAEVQVVFVVRLATGGQVGHRRARPGRHRRLTKSAAEQCRSQQMNINTGKSHSFFSS